MTTAQKPSWKAPTPQPADLTLVARLSENELARWQRATRSVYELATAHNYSKAEVSRRAAIPNGTFNQWYEGTYAGILHNITEKVERWLDAVDQMSELIEAAVEEPPFVLTKSASQIHQALTYALTSPEMVVVSVGAGCGKTWACKAFRDRVPHVYLTTMCPRVRTPPAMLHEIGQELNLKGVTSLGLPRAIGRQLQRNGQKTLLIVDEAQNLNDEAVDQLRYFLDNFGCGVALVGNTESYSRFSKQDGQNYAQLRRRIGMRVKIDKPFDEDIRAIIDNWNVTDPEIRELLTLIGNRPGALGHIAKTMQLATIVANGAKRAVTLKDVKSAWANRNAGA